MLLLSYREIQIIRLISFGYTAKEIARKLNIGYRTVEKYAQNIRKKLKARNMTHAVFLAVHGGLITVQNAQQMVVN